LPSGLRLRSLVSVSMASVLFGFEYHDLSRREKAEKTR
jgi:hypothetical protein